MNDVGPEDARRGGSEEVRVPDVSRSVTAAHRTKGRTWRARIVLLIAVCGASAAGLGGIAAPPAPVASPTRATEGGAPFDHIPIGNMECTACHDPESMNSGTWTFTLTLPGGEAERTAVFPHVRHAPLGCTTCHGRPPQPVPEDFTCGWTCHTPHLRARQMDCRVCHEPPPQWAHEYGVVHLGCTGSLCHSLPIEDELPWRRPLCMVCHQDLQAYIPEVPLPGEAVETALPADTLAGADSTVVPDTS